MTTIAPTPFPDTNLADIMSAKEQAVWLTKKIDESIKYVTTKREHFQRWAGSIRVLVLVLSGVITALLGVRWERYADVFRNVAFIIGTVTTILASLDLYFNYRSLWVEHEEAKWRLHRLKERIEFYMQGRADQEIDPAVISKFHEAYQWIWDNLSTSWLSLRRNSHIT